MTSPRLRTALVIIIVRKCCRTQGNTKHEIGQEAPLQMRIPPQHCVNSKATQSPYPSRQAYTTMVRSTIAALSFACIACNTQEAAAFAASGRGLSFVARSSSVARSGTALAASTGSFAVNVDHAAGCGCPSCQNAHGDSCTCANCRVSHGPACGCVNCRADTHGSSCTCSACAMAAHGPACACPGCASSHGPACGCASCRA